MSSKSTTPSTTQKKHTGLFAMFATIAIQLTLGIAYLWSIFQAGVAQSIFATADGEPNNAAAGLTFSLLLATLTVGSVIGGKLAAKYSTRVVVFIGGIILGAGFLLASFVTSETPWLLWVTYGVMGGTGMGFSYSTSIACVQKWYPHKRGLVTGIVVSALGFGGVVFTPVIEGLIKAFGGEGIGEPRTFMVLSVIFFVVCAVGSIFMKNPPAPETAPGAAPAVVPANETTPGQMLRDPRFYLLTLAFALACMGGLMMINYAKPLAVMKNLESTATIGVLAISLFNSGGRLVWGMVSDKIGRINTIVVLLGGSAVLALFVKGVQGPLLFVLIAAIGFFYGGFLSTFPSLTADLFGAKHMATNYGFVLLGFGAGAIASSQISGYFRNSSAIIDSAGKITGYDINRMAPAFLIGAGCAMVSVLLILLLKVMDSRRTAKKPATSEA